MFNAKETFLNISADQAEKDILRGFAEIDEKLKYDQLLDREKRIPYVANKIGEALFRGLSPLNDYIVLSTDEEDEFLKDIYKRCGEDIGNMFFVLFVIANNRAFLSCDLCKHNLNNSCPKKRDKKYSCCLEMDALILKNNVSWMLKLMGKGKSTLYTDAKAIEKILEEETDKENNFVLESVKRAIGVMERMYEYGTPMEQNLLDEVIKEKIELLRSVKKNEQKTEDSGDVG